LMFATAGLFLVCCVGAAVCRKIIFIA